MALCSVVRHLQSDELRSPTAYGMHEAGQGRGTQGEFAMTRGKEEAVLLMKSLQNL